VTARCDSRVTVVLLSLWHRGDAYGEEGRFLCLDTKVSSARN